jgi:predicted negative regulator of RcsB-dependent stress response
MKRFLFLSLVVSIGFLACSDSVRSQDKIERKDRKAQDKLVIINGEIIDETPAGINIKTGVKTELVPAADIQRVLYMSDKKVPAGVIRLNFNNLFLNEEKEKDPGKLLKQFKDIEGAMPAANADAKRYLQYRVAVLTFAAARTEAEIDQAKVVLAKFAADHPGSWEFPLVARQVARLQIDKGEFAEAGKTLDALIKADGVPADIKQEAANMYVDVLFQNNEFDKVKEKITAAKAAPGTTEAQKARLAVYEIGCDAQGEFKLDDIVKKLKETITKTNDNSVKALAYNIMGDCYMKSKDKRNAMWSWLWVDVVYNQDVGEHVKAMTKLLKYFTDESDLEKKQLYEEKLKRTR